MISPRGPDREPPTGARSKKAGQRVVRPVAFPITVVLGDPRLPDADRREGRFQPEDLHVLRRLKTALGQLREYRFSYLDDHGTLVADLRRLRPAFVLNFCDEGLANDPHCELHIPALLETLGIAYSGAGPAGLGFCFNKVHVSATAAALGIRGPREVVVAAAEGAPDAAAVGWPAIVKPVQGDGGAGITAANVVHTPGELRAVFENLRRQRPGQSLLVQEFLAGPEYTVGIIGNPGSKWVTLPILSPDYSRLPPALPQILGFESKWLPESPYWKKIRYGQAALPAGARRLLCEQSKKLFERCECRDYARIDFRAGADGEIRFLEVNPNPAWYWDAKLARMAGLAGWSYAGLLRRIIETARIRLGL